MPALRDMHISPSFGNVPALSQTYTGCCPRRYVVAFLSFLGFANIYTLRANLSVAIIAMTNNHTRIVGNKTVVSPPEFNWNIETQGIVLSSFFWGYIATQLPGGYIAVKFGGKRLLGTGVAVTALLTIFTPYFVRKNFYFLIAARIIEGIFEGVSYPATHGLWSRWAPPAERSRLVSISFSGSYFGTVIVMPLSGFLSEYFDWPSIFYTFGIAALIWCLIWFAWVFETPSEDLFISDLELNYIQDSIGNQGHRAGSMPWKKILTSAPVWAIVAAHYTENWGFYTMLTELPSYMEDRFSFSLKSATILEALPYLVAGTIVQIGGFVADWLRGTGLMTTTTVRKSFIVWGFLGQACFLTSAAHSDNPISFIARISCGVACAKIAWTGIGVNHLDIAPPYAGVLMGISNTIGTLAGIITPSLSGYLVHSDHSIMGWRKVFYISAGTHVVGAVIYYCLGSGKIQPWALEEPCIEDVDEEDAYVNNDESTHLVQTEIR
ncbi:unnamed protein product [Bemisia tabaci]|uniref:Sialin n=1 Tax=Bemisia tabaci TaxID=7038 RepID=A0A9P0G4U3_BEMTA|nr:unnamed protein product [Bemisia tabaci]